MIIINFHAAAHKPQGPGAARARESQHTSISASWRAFSAACSVSRALSSSSSGRSRATTSASTCAPCAMGCA